MTKRRRRKELMNNDGMGVCVFMIPMKMMTEWS